MTQKEKATVQGGFSNVVGGHAQSTCETKQHANHTVRIVESTVADVLDSKSTSTEIQLAKVMKLLRSGPKTTIQLRDHGIMMPAARIHHLRHVEGHTIVSENVTLFDGNGFRHSKCARYRLVEGATVGEAGRE